MRCYAGSVLTRVLLVAALAAWPAAAAKPKALSSNAVSASQLAEAERLYRDLEYGEAAARFAAFGTDASRSAPERASALAWAGLSRAQDGAFDEADRFFAEAVALDDAVALPDHAPPKVKAQLERARAAAVEANQPAPVIPPPSPSPLPPPVVGAGTPSVAPPPPSMPLLIGAGVSFAAGAAAFGGSAILGVAVADNAAIANDPSEFQSVSKAALDEANGQLAVALALGAAGVALVGLGAGLGAFAFPE